MNFQMKDLEPHMTDFLATTHISDGQGNLDAPVDWESAVELDDDPWLRSKEDTSFSITKEA